MKIVFAGGGTGGHINPAISIANYIKKRDCEFEALFIGTKRGLETKLVPKAGYNIKYVDVYGFDRKNLLKNIRILKKLRKSINDCVEILKEFNPDAVVCTGGYVSAPVAVAAHKLKISALIHEQNVYPGLTVKGAQKCVDYVATSFAETQNHLKDTSKCIFSGNPVREEILKADKMTARAELKLGEKPCVLIFGGSLGAGKINENIVKILPQLAADNKIQLIFGTGERNYQNVLNQINKIKLPADFKILPYIDNMHTVMAASDLVISRAGAITVSEIAVLGKPSILIPSPNVVRNHQEQNARELEKNNAATVICEAELTPDVLYGEINKLVCDKSKLDKMSQNAKKMAKTDALQILYDTVLKCVQKTKENKLNSK